MIGKAMLFWLLSLVTVILLTGLWVALMNFIVQACHDQTGAALTLGCSLGLVVPFGLGVLIMAGFYDLLNGKAEKK